MHHSFAFFGILIYNKVYERQINLQSMPSGSAWQGRRNMRKKE